jgi:hypothetical protein
MHDVLKGSGEKSLLNRPTIHLKEKKDRQTKMMCRINWSILVLVNP